MWEIFLNTRKVGELHLTVNYLYSFLTLDNL